MDKHHAAWLERHADRDEAWLTAMLKEGFDVHHLDRTPQGVQRHDELAGRILALPARRRRRDRKAGNYDVDTVREYKIQQCEAVVKGGRLLEEEGPAAAGDFDRRREGHLNLD